jgi:hypothetical protein
VAALGEEQRLLYVATSRTAGELHLSWAGPVPSRWIAAIEAAAATRGLRPSPPHQARRLAALRETVDSRPPAERRRRAALVAWRAGRARAARVPPEVILPDGVLTVLAEVEPARTDEFLRTAGHGGRLGAWVDELVPVLTADGRP